MTRIVCTSVVVKVVAGCVMGSSTVDITVVRTDCVPVSAVMAVAVAIGTLVSTPVILDVAKISLTSFASPAVCGSLLMIWCTLP